MGLSVMMLMVLLFVSLGSCGNINTRNCPITGGCLACISSRSRDVERCLQLFALVSATVSLVACVAQSMATTCNVYGEGAPEQRNFAIDACDAAIYRF